VTALDNPSVGPGLKITRKPGESVVIDGPAEIIITETTGSRCSLRIVAESGVTILRKELIIENSNRHRRDDSVPSEAGS